MDEILPFRDQFSCGAAACHTEHHMVWLRATFSHEHRGRSFKLAMMGPLVLRQPVWITALVMCDSMNSPPSLHPDPENVSRPVVRICAEGDCVFEWRCSVYSCSMAAWRMHDHSSSLSFDFMPSTNNRWAPCLLAAVSGCVYPAQISTWNTVRSILPRFVSVNIDEEGECGLCSLGRRQHTWVTTSFLP